MMEIIFSPESEQDLDEIFTYTVKTWGRDQARHYTQKIIHKIDDIAGGKHLNRRCNDTISFCRCGSHYIFYQRLNDIIEIVRILHGSRNFVDHLGHYHG